MKADLPTILIVEDEPSIAALLMYTLQCAGWSPCVAASAAEGWEALKTSMPMLVVLDWMLPDRPGVSLLRDIRHDRAFDAMPVLMLTAKSMSEDRAMCLGNGANAYMTKPFSPRELSSRIKQLLRCEDIGD